MPPTASDRSRLVTTIIVVAALAFVFFVPVRTCRTCNGIGTFIFKCTSCEGDGKQTVWEILSQPRK
jgi:DnaJ-class molecular chaperone